MNVSSTIYDGKRIDVSQALELFDWDLLELGKAADFRRRWIKNDEDVGFIIDRIINITNVCEAGCRFCAFHARAGRIAPYTLSIDDILAKVRELVNMGGSQVMLQGGLHPEWRIDDYVRIVLSVKRMFPNIWLHSFSPAEIVHMGRKSRLSVDETVIALKEAGADSIPGASDLLVDDIRKQIAPKKLTTDEWCTVMRSLACNGMMSSATMTYGMGETPKQRIQHLDVIRSIQDECGNIMAFIAWSFAPGGTRMSHVRQATSVDYLRMAAISRIYLDNVVFLQTGWLTEGLQTAQLALSMGANDMGGVLTEERVIQATGAAHHTDRDATIRLIRNAGKTPVLRDSRYRVLKRFEEGTRP
ncbi:MAG: CofH family radical SAM protein [Thermodesulfobacteriota bacterium]